LHDLNINPETALNSLHREVAPGSLFSAESWIWFPARAMFFDPGSVVLTVGVTAAIATFTVYALNQTFVQGTQQSVTRKRRARTTEGTTLQEGFNRVVLMKEWRMIWRNPFLISQVALQILLIIPLTWIMLRGSLSNEGLDIGKIASFATPLLGGQLSLTLTYVCLSGEEAADLLKSAPVPRNSMRRLKQLAALIPVWLVLLPIFVILMVQGRAWFPALFATLGSTIMASFLKLWNARLAPPGQLFKRQDARQMDFLLALIEQVSFWAWAWLGFLLYSDVGYGALILFCVLGVLFALGYWRGRQLGSFLAF
jgi:ABC-2 type transport system permease protein